MQALRRSLDEVAGATVPVLIEGESGTGKETIALLIHRRSPRMSGAFVKVNCPAVPGAHIESGLFGSPGGALAGAGGEQPGRAEPPQCTTLFLDEISELDLSLQSKLLQLLQDGQPCRIGALAGNPIAVRIICATSRRLEDGVKTGRFRQDLFYRLNMVTLRLPPLRERSIDIPDLVDYFLQVFSDTYHCAAQAPSNRLLRWAIGYSWPGNIRELENFIRRYVLLGSEDATGNELGTTELRPIALEVPVDGPISLKKVTKNAVREIERQVIFKVLQANHWNRKRAARALDISYRALLYKLKEAGGFTQDAGRADDGQTSVVRGSPPGEERSGNSDSLHLKPTGT